MKTLPLFRIDPPQKHILTLASPLTRILTRSLWLLVLLAAMGGRATAQLTADADTLLLLPLDGSTAGAQGESHALAGSIAYAPGVFGQAARFTNLSVLHYATAGNITATQGTVEFWIRPSWNGNQQEHHHFFSVGQPFNNGLVFAIDSANNLRFLQWGDDPSTPEVETSVERGVGYGAAHWVAGQWYHLAGTWDGATREVAMYVNGRRMVVTTDGVNIPSFSTIVLSVGNDLNGNVPSLASLDEFRISSRARTEAEIFADYLDGGTALGQVRPLINGTTHHGYINRGTEDIWTITANAGDSIVVSMGD